MASMEITPSLAGDLFLSCPCPRPEGRTGLADMDSDLDSGDVLPVEPGREYRQGHAHATHFQRPEQQDELGL